MKSYKHKMIWHYTKSNNFQKIYNHGFLLPSPEPTGKKNVLWFSAEEYWENSINGGSLKEGYEIPEGTLEEEKLIGLTDEGDLVNEKKSLFSQEQAVELVSNIEGWTMEKTIEECGGLRFGVDLTQNLEEFPNFYHWDRLWKKAGFSYKYKRALEVSRYPEIPFDSSKWYGCLRPIRLDQIDVIEMLDNGEWKSLHWEVTKFKFLEYVENTINGVGKGRFDPYPPQFKKEWLKKMTPDMIVDCYGEDHPENM
jgi:hypothetical protein